MYMHVYTHIIYIEILISHCGGSPTGLDLRISCHGVALRHGLHGAGANLVRIWVTAPRNGDFLGKRDGEMMEK